MRFFELTHRGFGECGPALSVPGGPPVLAGLQPRSSGLVGGPGPKLTQLSKTLHVYCSITSKAATEGGFPLAKQIQKAKDVLSLHGLTLIVEFGGSPGFADTIPFPYGLVLDEDVALLRKASEATRPGAEKIVRLIACPRSVNAAMGETFRDITVGGKLFPAFAVLNSNAVAPDGATLIHEMIHCAHDRAVKHDGETNSVFFGDTKPGQAAVERTVLKSDSALTLSKGFFAT